MGGEGRGGEKGRGRSSPPMLDAITPLTNRLYHATELGNISHMAGDNTNIMYINNKRIQ